MSENTDYETLKSERDSALNTCSMIADALGITGAVAGDTIAKVKQLVAESAALKAENCIQDFIISAVKDLVRESDGVTGWHRNGDVATALYSEWCKANAITVTATYLVAPDNVDITSNDYSDWKIVKPSGEWFLLAIEEFTNGPVCIWGWRKA